jgi:hypothetical protein
VAATVAVDACVFCDAIMETVATSEAGRHNEGRSYKLFDMAILPFQLWKPTLNIFEKLNPGHHDASLRFGANSPGGHRL